MDVVLFRVLLFVALVKRDGDAQDADANGTGTNDSALHSAIVATGTNDSALDSAIGANLTNSTTLHGVLGSVSNDSALPLGQGPTHNINDGDQPAQASLDYSKVCRTHDIACRYSEASPRLSITVGGILGSQGPLNGVTGDGGPATDARFRLPRSLSLDAASRKLYMVENHAVRLINLENGALSTVGGVLGSKGRVGNMGFPAFSGFREPMGIAVNPVTHQVYIADTGNHVIRMLDLSSDTVSIVAGISGEGGNGDDFVAATSAKLRFPHGVSVDSTHDKLYVADTYNHVVRVVELGMKTISTVAGIRSGIATGYGGARTGESSNQARWAELYFPHDITLDPIRQELFIADTNNHVIRMVDLVTGALSTVAGVLRSPGFDGDVGPATSAQLHLPNGIDIDWASRQLYIADTHNHAIRQLDIPTAHMTTVAGTLGTPGLLGEREPATSAQLHLPTDVAVDQNAEARLLYVADSNNYVVRAVDLETFVLTTPAGELGKYNKIADVGLATSALFHHPRDVALDESQQHLYIADTSNHVIQRLDLVQGNISIVAGTFGSSGPDANSLYFPFGIAVDSTSRYLYIAEAGNHVIRALDLDNGTLSTLLGTPGLSGSFGDNVPSSDILLQSPSGVAVHPSKDILLISDTGNHVIRSLNISSGILSIVSGVLGVFGLNYDTGEATIVLLNFPYGLDIDPLNENVYIADSANHVVRMLNLTEGRIQTIAGVLGSYGHADDGEPATSAQLYFPFNVAINPHLQKLFIADNWNHAIRLVNLATGTMTTVAGTLGTYGLMGDGGRATRAQLHSPMGLAVDSYHRRVYIADASNHAIRRLAVSNDVRFVNLSFATLEDVVLIDAINTSCSNDSSNCSGNPANSVMSPKDKDHSRNETNTSNMSSIGVPGISATDSPDEFVPNYTNSTNSSN